jgi:DNA-binding NarL/FixJ family response regulator
MPPRNMPRRDLHVTPRQRQILNLAARGLTDKEIASELRIAIGTVRTHLEHLYRDNGLRNKTEAVAVWQHHLEAEGRRRHRPPQPD